MVLIVVHCALNLRTKSWLWALPYVLLQRIVPMHYQYYHRIFFSSTARFWKLSLDDEKMEKVVAYSGTRITL